MQGGRQEKGGFEVMKDERKGSTYTICRPRVSVQYLLTSV